MAGHETANHRPGRPAPPGIRAPDFGSRAVVSTAVRRILRRPGSRPLAWYNALLELLRGANRAKCPCRSGKAMLSPQYMTRGLTRTGWWTEDCARRECQDRQARPFRRISEAGARAAEKLWSAYSVRRRSKACGLQTVDADAVNLCGLLAAWGCSSCGDTQALAARDARAHTNYMSSLPPAVPDRIGTRSAPDTARVFG